MTKKRRNLSRIHGRLHGAVSYTHLDVYKRQQVRYRTETRTDSEGNEYEVEVPYNYYILHVDLENFNLSHVPVYICLLYTSRCV